MTVSSQLNRKSFAGDGATTSFATTPVVFFDTSDLEVYVLDTVTGIQTLLVLDTDYTVTGGAGSTGTVNLAGGSSPYGAPSADENLIILRVLPLTQETDFVQNDPSDADVAEEALDRLVMVAQQLDEANDRAIKLPATSSLTDIEMPDPTGFAGYVVVVNDDEDGFTLVTAVAAGVTPVSPFMATVLDDTTAGAALTTLGFSAFAQTLIDDASAAAARDTLGAEGHGYQTLTDAATINWDAASGQLAKVTLGDNRTMAAPTNLVEGREYTLVVIQDGTGSRTITWNAVFKWPLGVAPTLSTAGGSKDLLVFKYLDSVLLGSMLKGMA
jgi:hypothetical protein